MQDVCTEPLRISGTESTFLRALLAFSFLPMKENLDNYSVLFSLRPGSERYLGVPPPPQSGRLRHRKMPKSRKVPIDRASSNVNYLPSLQKLYDLRQSCSWSG